MTIILAGMFAIPFCTAAFGYRDVNRYLAWLDTTENRRLMGEPWVDEQLKISKRFRRGFVSMMTISVAMLVVLLALL